MNLLEEIKKINGTPKQLKEFGLLVGGIFLCLAGLLFWKGRGAAPFFLVLGGALLVPGLLAPGLLRFPYKGWMGLALVMGAVMSRVILTLVFLLVMTPLALIARFRGDHLLDLLYPDRKETYWEKKTLPSGPEAYEKQF